MRLFVGSFVDTAPEVFRAEVERIRDEVVRRDPGWRPTPSENLHVTLAFLGERDASEVEPLREVLFDVRGLLPLEVSLGFCYAPHARASSKVLAVGLEPRDTLGPLLRSVRSIFGVDADVQSDWAHVTVCRSRRPRVWRSVTDEIVPKPVAPWRLSEVSLVQSELRPGGSRYIRLATIRAS